MLVGVRLTHNPADIASQFFTHLRIRADRAHGAGVPHERDPARLDQRRHLHGGQPASRLCAAERAIS